MPDTTNLDPEFLKSLQPPPDSFGGTGAVPLIPDERDYPATAHPEVRATLLAGVPGSADRSSGVCEILNQGQTGSCVTHSTCHGIQLDNNLDRGICYHFNAMQLYGELGGTGQNGVDSRQTLQRCVDLGAPLTTGGRVKIGSYFAVERVAGRFEEQIKAAVSTGQVAVIALLLPSTFGGRWTPGAVTSGYHQVEIAGYNSAGGGSGGLFWGPNSWGSGWSSGSHPPGFYELSFDYCVASNFQNGYCYAFFYDPFEVHTPNPDPGPGPGPGPGPTPKRIFIAGELSGAGKEAVAVGQTCPIVIQGKACTIAVNTRTESDGPGPNPDPNPDPIPTPGDLQVNLKIYPPLHGQTYADVTATGPESMPANLTWNVSGTLATQVTVNGGFVRSRLKDVVTGQLVTVTAVQGVHRGSDTERVP